MSHPWDEYWETIKALRPGGQGITRLVRDRRDENRTGVLKYLKNNQSPQARARMQREVTSLQSMFSLGAKVPRVLEHNTGEFENLAVELYLVMEFIEGQTLKELIEKEGVRPADQAASFASALCQTVGKGHKEGILHRDIKPDNIIVRDASKNNLYIVDYGLSFNADDSDLTQTAEMFKNKFLDLPETNTPSGSNRDPRSDVTAICAVFYYMLTGHTPGHLQDGEGRMPHLRPGFTVRDVLSKDSRLTQIELILSQGLASQLPRRFQNVDELSARLTSLLGQTAMTNPCDPVATAVSLSEQLRQHDRKTQLEEFTPAANKLLKGLQIMSQNSVTS